jgi:hypothetical protein
MSTGVGSVGSEIELREGDEGEKGAGWWSASARVGGGGAPLASSAWVAWHDGMGAAQCTDTML